jgi:ADP-ribose pyrophosphatase YjhB (NUDIX family)
VRKYPDTPIVAVGAVILDGDHVLLVQRGQEPLKGEWSLPGGVVELGETLEGALTREVREETSLDVVVGAVVDVLDSIRRDAGGRVEYHYIIVDYACRVRGGTSTVASRGTDAADVRWVAVCGSRTLRSHHDRHRGHSKGRRMRTLTTLIVAASLAANLASQRPQPAPSDVDLVELDIVALDRNGQPVTDLSENEVTIKEDGRKVELKAFSKVTALGSTRPAMHGSSCC